MPEISYALETRLGKQVLGRPFEGYPDLRTLLNDSAETRAERRDLEWRIFRSFTTTVEQDLGVLSRAVTR